MTPSEILPPMLATVHVRPARWRWGVRLWLPLFLLWLLLLPLLILLLPFLFIACAVFGIRLFRSLGAVFALLAGVKGSRVEVENPGARVFIHIR